MPQYETGEQRAAREEAELAQLEGGQDQQVADTPQDPEQQPAQVDWEKRYKDLQSHSSKQITQLQSQVPDGEFETENEKLQRQVAELHNDLEARNVADGVRDAQQQVGTAHPDFEAIIGSEAFAQWIKVQPEVFYKSIYDDVPNAALAIKALSLFKLENQPQQQQETRQPDPASMQIRERHRETPQEINGPKIWTMQEIQRMTPAQYEKHEAELDVAFAEGRIR